MKQLSEVTFKEAIKTPFRKMSESRWVSSDVDIILHDGVIYLKSDVGVVGVPVSGAKYFTVSKFWKLPTTVIQEIDAPKPAGVVAVPEPKALPMSERPRKTKKVPRRTRKAKRAAE